LAGSARFRKFALVKTAAVSVAWMACLGLLWFGLALLFAGGHVTLREMDLPESKRIALEILSGISKTAAFVARRLYGYFRVAEKESVDEFSDDRPIYEQIADSVAAEVAAGRLAAGGRIPSARSWPLPWR
jgi:hypothetical protein